MLEKNTKIICILSIVSLLISVNFLCACSDRTDFGMPDPEPPHAEAEFLPGYALDHVRVGKDAKKSSIKFGDAEFAALKIVDGEYTMKYRAYIPAAAGKSPFPILMFFHGAGERGDDNGAQITAYDAFGELFYSGSPLNDAIVIAPQCPVGEQWVDVPNWASCEYSTDEIPESKALSTALKILKYNAAVYYADTTRVYAMGLSMGGYATWDTLVRHNEAFAAGIPICGGCDTSKAEILKETSIRTFHGSADGTVPPTGTRTMYAKLKELHSDKVSYTEYENAGHGIWNDAMRSEGLMTWLLGCSNG